MNCTSRVAKTKAQISFTVTAKLICAFVFAYAKCWFFIMQPIVAKEHQNGVINISKVSVMQHTPELGGTIVCFGMG